MKQQEWTGRVVASIIRRRKALGMSAQKLSDALEAQGRDMPRSTIANLESGRRSEMSIEDLVAFAGALATTPMDLLGYECPTCNNKPPHGFKCMACGQVS